MISPAVIAAWVLASAAFWLPSASGSETINPPQSLFFHNDEVQAIAAARRNGRTSVPGSKPSTVRSLPPQKIHLSAIMLFEDGSFEVWLNGRRYTDHSSDENLTLVDLTPTAVRIRAERGPASGRVFEIGLNQTVELSTGSRREGPMSGRLADLPFHPLP